jgi:hypothetical protein
MVGSIEPVGGELQQAGQVPPLEDPHHHAERGRQRQHVHHDRLQRQHHRAERTEQQHERADAGQQRHPGQSGAEVYKARPHASNIPVSLSLLAEFCWLSFY